jgi:adenylate cyclase class IV
MSINKRQEVEAKFRLGKDFSSLRNARKQVLGQGFFLIEKRIETDFLPDTADGSLKKNKLLLRFRYIETLLERRWLLTLKKRNENTELLDFEEIETELANISQPTLVHINKILEETVGINLEGSILKPKSLNEVMKLVAKLGLGAVRILLDKYREEYAKDSTRITLDYFPDGMGSFLEVETHSENDTKQVYALLGFAKNKVITTDYGDLLKEHKSHLTDAERRNSVFNAKTRDLLLSGKYDD